ncbi:DUF6879 family protein [Streptomyces anandii]|uniref:DUF6879 family protein n=1 Tax=Streptomyces anandii TaxID=285454 RepID=UPI0016759979|nr:DUF6879 family protein [Streptomyces anandii]GGX94797.1 hypothetical protein GCM10010510_45110 [Streptomyces anandii JCM 4720]
MPSSEPTFAELLAGCERGAVHLEMRDSYAVDEEAADLDEWRRTGRRDADPTSAYWAPWVQLIAGAVARGVVVRRVRVVSEPVSEYIRYEHAATGVNVAAGERVRWLPRRRASDLALPGNDFWLIDDRLIRWHHFSGDGVWAGQEFSEDPAAVKLCADAFEGAWARATPHDQYRLR